MPQSRNYNEEPDQGVSLYFCHTIHNIFTLLLLFFSGQAPIELPSALILFLLVMWGLWRRPLQHGHPAEVSGSPEGSLQPRKKLKVTLATRSGVTQIVIFLTH